MDLKDLQGKKTYIVMIATICYALGGMVSGLMEIGVGIPLILGALGLSGLRSGFNKLIDDLSELANKPAQ